MGVCNHGRRNKRVVRGMIGSLPSFGLDWIGLDWIGRDATCWLQIGWAGAGLAVLLLQVVSVGSSVTSIA